MRLLDHPAQLLIILAIVVLLFGGKKLPEAARGLGRSLRIFKSEVKEMQEEDRPAAAKSPEPLEGRIVDGEPQRASTPTDQRRDV